MPLTFEVLRTLESLFIRQPNGAYKFLIIKKALKGRNICI